MVLEIILQCVLEETNLAYFKLTGVLHRYRYALESLKMITQLKYDVDEVVLLIQEFMVHIE